MDKLELENKIKLLTDAAEALNSQSDELSRLIDIINQKIKVLNLGIAAWHIVDEEGKIAIGYAKVGGKWGIAITRGDNERWQFAQAPRELRILTTHYIPYIFPALTAAARKLTSDVSAASFRVHQTIKEIENK